MEMEDLFYHLSVSMYALFPTVSFLYVLIGGKSGREEIDAGVQV